jgi:hypothetical protein
MSELEQAAEKFRQRWGFDPRPEVKRAMLAGDFEIVGGTEDEREFILASMLSDRLAAAIDGTAIGVLGDALAMLTKAQRDHLRRGLETVKDDD